MNNNNNTVVITRHSGLVQYLTQQGIIPAGVDVIAQASADDVRGKDVVGVLPLQLAALANSVTVVDLNVPAELRGQDLNAEQVAQFATGISRYTVNAVPVK